MGVRNVKKEELIRLQAKSLDARFLEIVQHGLNCSRFEANAVLEAVHEVYFPFPDEACARAPPGKMTLVAVAAEEPPGKAIAECEKKTVCLTVLRGAIDDELLARQGPAAFRRARIADLCQQAFSQDALLTREDLAHRVFFVGTRTISRDLQILRAGAPPPLIPLRSNIQDIGPLLSQWEDEPGGLIPRRTTIHDVGSGLTHKRLICRKRFLEGKASDVIGRETDHSLEAVDRYLGQYDRVRHGRQQGFDVAQTAHVLGCSRGLVERYLAIDDELERRTQRRKSRGK